MHDIKSNIKLVEHIAAASKAVTTHDGATVNLSGYSNVSFALTCGTVGASGTIDAKVQYSDDGTNWFDATTAMTGEAVTIAQKTAVFSALLHVTKPTKKFYRVRVTIGVAASVVSAYTILGGARHLPVGN